VQELRLAVAMVVGAALAARPARAADADVRVSSVGYPTSAAKRVSVVGGDGAAFAVRRSGDGSAAFQGTLPAAVMDDSGDMVAIGDFGALAEAGTFYVDVDGVGRSVDFPVADDAFRVPFRTAMLGFFSWRCGTAISFVYQGQTYAHGACHLDDGHLDYIGQAGATRDGQRGWHDAGDYGKYTVNGAFAAGMMLDAWERHGSALSGLTLPIPESGGALPDYLAEIQWELDWILTMQYGADDGRVSHKLTRLAFEDFIMPEDDDGIRYFVPYGTAATADFVAVLAEAARVYQPYDPAFAARCLAAAQVSYAYLQANIANVATDESAFTTGGYGTTDPDDRLWAAAEMWETTGDAAALADLEARIAATTDTAARPLVDADFDWGNTKNLGLYAYVLSQRAGRDPTLLARVHDRALSAADAVVSAHDASGYGRGVARYYWGSNGSVARTSMLLDVAYRLGGDRHYLDVAVDQVAYLFGRNHYGRSHVTGLGVDPPISPHHRLSHANPLGLVFPGLLVGGGTSATNWEDNWINYMVNEVAVNWNAPLLYAMALFLPDGAWPPPDTSAPDAGAIDAAGVVDATTGGAPDAGVPGAPDAAGGVDASSPEGPGASASKSGCSCALGRGAGGAGAAAALLLAGLVAALRARRRR
jgi:endoglucanase